MLTQYQEFMLLVYHRKPNININGYDNFARIHPSPLIEDLNIKFWKSIKLKLTKKYVYIMKSGNIVFWQKLLHGRLMEHRLITIIRYKAI